MFSRQMFTLGKLQVKRFPPWLDEGGEGGRAGEFQRTIESIERHLHLAKTDLDAMGYLPTFVRRSGLVHVCTSIKLEGTMPQNAHRDATYALLEELWDETEVTVSDADTADATQTWPIDVPGDGRPTSAQLRQHVRALKYLFSSTVTETPLTEEHIQRAYQLLVTGAVDEDGGRLAPFPWKMDVGPFAQYRTITLYAAGGYVFTEADDVQPALQRAIRRFNDSRVAILAGDASYEFSPVYVATRLFHDMLVIHPFRNGNGRLSRMLLAYALFVLGVVPFPVSYSCGQSSQHTRQHYMSGIKRIDANGEFSFAIVDVVLSIGAALSNFAVLANTKKMTRATGGPNSPGPRP